MHKNHEGYSDPVAGKAIRRADRPPEGVINFRRAMKLMEERELTENEQKKLFLRSYLRDKQAVIRIEEQLAELRANKISPSVINDGMPHGTELSDLSDYAARVDELERELIRKRYDRICSFRKVQAAIEAMEDEAEKDLLTYRYLRGMKWEEIAVKMGYSWKHMHRMFMIH